MKKEICLLVLLAFLSFAGDVQAYLDPNTGAMIISAIVGVFASIALAVKTYWYKLKSFFRGGSKNTPETED